MMMDAAEHLYRVTSFIFDKAAEGGLQVARSFEIQFKCSQLYSELLQSTVVRSEELASEIYQ